MNELQKNHISSLCKFNVNLFDSIHELKYEISNSLEFPVESLSGPTVPSH